MGNYSNFLVLPDGLCLGKLTRNWYFSVKSVVSLSFKGECISDCAPSSIWSPCNGGAEGSIFGVVGVNGISAGTGLVVSGKLTFLWAANFKTLVKLSY